MNWKKYFSVIKRIGNKIKQLCKSQQIEINTMPANSTSSSSSDTLPQPLMTLAAGNKFNYAINGGKTNSY